MKEKSIINISNNRYETRISIFNYLITSLDNSWLIYNKRLKRCKQLFTETSVHDFRVSIRRFQSLASLLFMIYDCSYFFDIKSIIKQQLKIFGNLRDTQVQILKIKDIRYGFKELNPYYFDILKREQIHIAEIKRALNVLSTVELGG